MPAPELEPGAAEETESNFTFDDSLVTPVALLIDRLGREAGDPAYIASACYSDTEFESLPVPVQGALTTAFGYELDESPASGGRVRLTPETERDGWWMVRPYAQTPREVAAFWCQLAEAVESPIALAQLHDLVLSTRTDATPSRAEAVISRYLDVAARPETDSLHAAMSILRAGEISRSRRMNLEDRIWPAGLDLLREKLDAHAAPGSPARLVDMLSDPPRSYALAQEQREVLLQLIALADELYRHPDAADWVADARRRLARTDEERLRATEEQVERYLAASDEAAGMAKMHWASRAADLARDHGATAAYELAVRRMQSIPRDAMEWQTTDFTMPVPTVAIRTHIRRVSKSDGWGMALSVFLASPSPAGSYENNRRVALAAAAGSIRSLFSTTIFGRHGLPERSDADFEDGEVRRTEQLSVGVHGILLNEELRAIRRRFGKPSIAETATFLEDRYGCDRELALEFGNALDLFWDERYSDASRLLIPLIEAGARGLLLRLDAALYRIERGESPGRFPAMDFYLDKLAELGLDPDWDRALRVVLLSPGSNMRNMAAHGFLFSFAASDAAVLLRLAGLFCAMPVLSDSEESRRQLSEPLKRPRRRLRRRLGWVWR